MKIVLNENLDEKKGKKFWEMIDIVNETKIIGI